MSNVECRTKDKRLRTEDDNVLVGRDTVVAVTKHQPLKMGPSFRWDEASRGDSGYTDERLLIMFSQNRLYCERIFTY